MPVHGMYRWHLEVPWPFVRDLQIFVIQYDLTKSQANDQFLIISRGQSIGRGSHVKEKLELWQLFSKADLWNFFFTLGICVQTITEYVQTPQPNII